MITAGVISSGYNTGPMNPGISTGAIRYQLAQMIRVSPFVFEQRRLRTRNSKRHGSMYEWRMKPQPPKPVTLTTWLVSFDKI